MRAPGEKFLTGLFIPIFSTTTGNIICGKSLATTCTWPLWCVVVTGGFQYSNPKDFVAHGYLYM